MGTGLLPKLYVFVWQFLRGPRFIVGAGFRSSHFESALPTPEIFPTTQHSFQPGNNSDPRPSALSKAFCNRSFCCCRRCCRCCCRRRRRRRRCRRCCCKWYWCYNHSAVGWQKLRYELRKARYAANEYSSIIDLEINWLDQYQPLAFSPPQSKTNSNANRHHSTALWVVTCISHHHVIHHDTSCVFCLLSGSPTSAFCLSRGTATLNLKQRSQT